MNALDLVKLTPLMDVTAGRAEIVVGLIDGPVAVDHVELAGGSIREIPDGFSGSCVQAGSAACMHGTFVAGILCGKRSSPAPAICPDCTLMVRPIFAETTPVNGHLPSASPEKLATAIVDIVDGGARVINLSVAIAQPSSPMRRELDEALSYAMRRGVIVVAAAGNQGTLGSNPITRHLWVIPVVAFDHGGRPTAESNLGKSIGTRGLGAPGESITSLSAIGKSHTLGGTSAATPFVTGAIALLWSAFPAASAAELKHAVMRASAPRKFTVVPPLLDTWATYRAMARAA